jgi:hypothetical protein
MHFNAFISISALYICAFVDDFFRAVHSSTESRFFLHHYYISFLKEYVFYTTRRAYTPHF